jgi:integrase
LEDGGVKATDGQVRRLMEATGNVHILRHTFCTRLAMARTAPTVIQALAGHRQLTAATRYMHVVPGVTAEAIKMLDRPLPKGLAPEETPEAAPGFGRIWVAVP